MGENPRDPLIATFLAVAPPPAPPGRVDRAGQRVAVKKVSNCFQHRVEARRVLRELKIQSVLEHDNIVQLYSIVGVPAGEAETFRDVYLVMEPMETNLERTNCDATGVCLFFLGGGGRRGMDGLVGFCDWLLGFSWFWSVGLVEHCVCKHSARKVCAFTNVKRVRVASQGDAPYRRSFALRS